MSLKDASLFRESSRLESNDLLLALLHPSVAPPEPLHRSLLARQINMITIAGTIGTGLYLGTGKALAKGGPLSLLLCYAIMGLIVYCTMLSLGEMAVQYPVSGSFTTYARRFGSDSLGFAILINYWFNDACSVAGDLTALQLVMQYWTDFPYYVVAIIFWFFLLFLNVIHVRFYGEAEYWLALLKVLSIIIFFVVSIVVNAGVNPDHQYYGFKWWLYGDAPIVNGFRGFASVFVTAAFAYGGTESITLTAAETKFPTITIRSTIKNVFWRIMVFYIFLAFFIGMNVRYDYPNLSTKSVTTLPFTIVFQMAGAKAAGSFMNAVILTSVISAGNHALYAGLRLAFNLGTQGYFPKVFTRVNRYHIPYVGVLFTWLCGGLCFASSFVGAGTLWLWIQSIVGLSNLISWWVIGVTSIRFRQGLERQGKTHTLLFPNWTYPYGPWFVVIFGGFVILVQGWLSFSPWSTTDFFQNYLELLVFPLTFLAWWAYKRGKDRFVRLEDMDFDLDRYVESDEELDMIKHATSLKGWAKFKHNFAANWL